MTMRASGEESAEAYVSHDPGMERTEASTVIEAVAVETKSNSKSGKIGRWFGKRSGEDRMAETHSQAAQIEIVLPSADRIDPNALTEFGLDPNTLASMGMDPATLPQFEPEFLVELGINPQIVVEILRRQKLAELAASGAVHEHEAATGEAAEEFAEAVAGESGRRKFDMSPAAWIARYRKFQKWAPAAAAAAGLTTTGSIWFMSGGAPDLAVERVKNEQLAGKDAEKAPNTEIAKQEEPGNEPEIAPSKDEKAPPDNENPPEVAKSLEEPPKDDAPSDPATSPVSLAMNDLPAMPAEVSNEEPTKATPVSDAPPGGAGEAPPGLPGLPVNAADSPPGVSNEPPLAEAPGAAGTPKESGPLGLDVPAGENAGGTPPGIPKIDEPAEKQPVTNEPKADGNDNGSIAKKLALPAIGGLGAAAALADTGKDALKEAPPQIGKSALSESGLPDLPKDTGSIPTEAPPGLPGLPAEPPQASGLPVMAEPPPVAASADAAATLGGAGAELPIPMNSGIAEKAPGVQPPGDLPSPVEESPKLPAAGDDLSKSQPPGLSDVPPNSPSISDSLPLPVDSPGTSLPNAHEPEPQAPPQTQEMPSDSLVIPNASKITKSGGSDAGKAAIAGAAAGLAAGTIAGEMKDAAKPSESIGLPTPSRSSSDVTASNDSAVPKNAGIDTPGEAPPGMQASTDLPKADGGLGSPVENAAQPPPGSLTGLPKDIPQTPTNEKPATNQAQAKPREADGNWTPIPNSRGRVLRSLASANSLGRNVGQSATAAAFGAGAGLALGTAISNDERYGGAIQTSPAPMVAHAPPDIAPIKHTVQSGENFWTISRDYYGSGRYYVALWAANASRIGKIDQLHVGDVVAIPSTENLDPSLIENTKVARTRRSADSDSEPAQVARSRDARTVRTRNEIESVPVGGEPGQKPVRRPVVESLDSDSKEIVSQPIGETSSTARYVRHRVKPGETLRTIAADRLGNARRADEIVELNSDILENVRTPLEPDMVLFLPMNQEEE
jgi:nucleoid-associated protein YgaU